MDTSADLPEGMRKRLPSLLADGASDPELVARDLEAIPVHVLDAILDEHDQWDAGERLAILDLLSRDPRDYIRVEVAARTSGFAEPLTASAERVMARLACDPVRPVRQTAASSLATVLQRLEGFTRTRVVGAWALSNFRGQRVAIGLALRWPFPVVGGTSAIELLATDDDCEVRIAAAEAAKIRLKDSPATCNTILQRLANDPDPAVRRAVGIDTERMEISEAPL
jgi:hypothetical protein